MGIEKMPQMYLLQIWFNHNSSLRNVCKRRA